MCDCIDVPYYFLPLGAIRKERLCLVDVAKLLFGIGSNILTASRGVLHVVVPNTTCMAPCAIGGINRYKHHIC